PAREHRAPARGRSPRSPSRGRPCRANAERAGGTRVGSGEAGGRHGDLIGRCSPHLSGLPRSGRAPRGLRGFVEGEMTRRARIVFVCGLTLAFGLTVAGQSKDLPELTQPVNDFAHVIDSQSAADMDRMIRQLKDATGDVVAVAAVTTIDGYG